MSKNSLKKSRFPVKRLVADALLVAMFFALSMVAVEIAGIKLTFVSLATVVCAMIYGPVDAVIVGLLGAFMEQMMKYGFTATTLLWILPAGIRALIVGCGALFFKEHMGLNAVIEKRKPYLYFTVCIAAGIVTSLANTFVYYIDAKIFGYYNYALIFGVLGTRIFTGVVSSAVTAFLAIPVFTALKKAKFIPVD